MKKILVTGGAGFVGSSICCWLRHNYSSEVIAFDNLKRRGSELILTRLKQSGVSFIHGDVRIDSDISEIGKIDLLIDCAAEPSVLAGIKSSPRYVIDTNLNGTINCLELARRFDAAFVFLSTSRVYPVKPLSQLRYHETNSRFDLDSDQYLTGASEQGISESFTLDGARSIYGATKLSSELIFQEYTNSFKMPGVINRCSILTGPWQMGKVDQGVVVLWVAKHFFKKSLSCIGYSGSGKQVRDLLHISDLCSLLEIQLKNISCFNGDIFNIGGGRACSVSLRELTELSVAATGNTIPVSAVEEQRINDIPIYLSDSRKAFNKFGWKPVKSPQEIIQEIADWIGERRLLLEPILT